MCAVEKQLERIPHEEGSTEEECYKAPTLSRVGNKLGSVAWSGRLKFHNLQ
jgi:hypothetical protein